VLRRVGVAGIAVAVAVVAAAAGGCSDDDGGRVVEEPATTATSAAAGVGTDALVEACDGGDNAACDELYRNTPVDSPAERTGATCGGRADEPLNGNCESVLG
jgi:hypothetical protein